MSAPFRIPEGFEGYRVVVEVTPASPRASARPLGEWEVRILVPEGWGGVDLLEDAADILRAERGLTGDASFATLARPYREGQESDLRGPIERRFQAVAPRRAGEARA